MKKLLAVILIISTVFSALCITSNASPAYVQGDANGDGTVDAKDSLAIKKHAANVESVSDFDAADINCDGNVSAKDLLELIRSFAGLEALDEKYPLEFGTVGRVRIGGNNIKLYTIDVTDASNPNMMFAAEELQKYVKKATNYELPISTEKTENKYRIELRADDTGTLGNDGFSITVNNGTLTILGGTLRGTMYGVYELIEEYIGYRFWGYEDVELSEATTLDIPEGLTNTQIPDTTYRNISTNPFHNQYTYSAVVKRKLSGATSAHSLNAPEYGYGIARTLANAHSFDVYANYEYFKSGNNFKHCLGDFSIIGGELEDVDSEEITQRSAYEHTLIYISNLLDERIAAGGRIGYDITEISVSYASNVDYCMCRSYGCKPTYQEEGSHAGILVPFVNAVDDYLREKYPGIRVITNAYSAVRIPPKTKKLNDSVVLLYCWNGCVNHTVEDAACAKDGVVVYNDTPLGSNTTEKEYYLGWMNCAKQSYIWYYPTNIYYSLAPLSNTFNIYHDMKWFIEHGAVGFYVVGTANDIFDGLNSYLISEMMWDKDISEDEYNQMIIDYMQFYYGAAWEYIYAYMLEMINAMDRVGCSATEYSHPMQMYDYTYFIENKAKMDALFENAIAADISEEQYIRIEKLKATYKYMSLEARYIGEYKNGSSEVKSAYEAEYRAWYNVMNNLDVRVTYQETGIDNLFNAEKSPSMLVYGFDEEY